MSRDGLQNMRNMQAAAEAAAPGLKKPTLKRYSWSRLHSDLLDDTRWSLVAKRAEAPLPIVEALVIRLEAHANNAQPRGDVLGFNLEAMAARWNIDPETVRRIYEELERPDIGWISQDQIVTFWSRNPDKIDETNAERQQRWRVRRRGMKQLALLLRQGAISEGVRLEREVALRDSRDPQAVISSWDVTLPVTAGLTPSVTRHAVTPPILPSVTPLVTPSVTRHAVTVTAGVTPSGNADRTAAARQRRARERKKALKDLQKAQISAAAVLQAGTAALADRADRDGITRYFVTVTPRAEQIIEAERDAADGPLREAADAPAPSARVEFADRAKALRWLEVEGEEIVRRRCQVLRSKASKMLQRWSVTLGDVTALAEIILATSATTAQGAGFEQLIVNQVARRAAERLGPQLPLPPVAVRRSGDG